MNPTDVNFSSHMEEYLAIDEIPLIAASKSPCWDGYKQVGMKTGKSGKMVPNCVPVDTADDSSEDAEFAKKRTAAQTPAPKKDRISGSKKNPKGSAAGGKKITFDAKTETALRNKVKEHNENSSAGRKASLSMLKAVYRRGAGAFSSSHRPGKSRSQWSMARVNAFLKLLKSGSPSNSAYKQDNDLLPASHPRSTKKKAAITASGLIPEEKALAEALVFITEKHGKFDQDGDGVWAGYTTANENEDAGIGVKCSNCVFYEGEDVCKIIALPVEPEGKCRFAVIPEGVVDISQVPVRDPESLELLLATAYADGELVRRAPKSVEDFETIEDLILSLCEFSGLGYDAENAFKASWLRAVEADQEPFRRVSILASMTYDSLDFDLLPKRGVDDR